MSSELLDEFKIEAEELLEGSEEALLRIEKAEDGELEQEFDEVFRNFHSLKGASGMFGVEDLQRHMHLLEDQFGKLRGENETLKSHLDYFLRGVDAAKDILNGESTDFDYTLGESTDFEYTLGGGQQAASAPTESASVVPVAVKSSTENYLKLIPEREVILVTGNNLLVSHFYTQFSKENVLLFETVKAAVEEKSFRKRAALLIDAEVFLNIDSQSLRILNQTIEVLIVYNEESSVLFEKIMNEIKFPSISMSASSYSLAMAFVNAKKTTKIKRLLKKSLGLVNFQYSDIDEYLKSQNKDKVREVLKQEVQDLVANSKTLDK